MSEVSWYCHYGSFLSCLYYSCSTLNAIFLFMIRMGVQKRYQAVAYSLRKREGKDSFAGFT